MTLLKSIISIVIHNIWTVFWFPGFRVVREKQIFEFARLPMLIFISALVLPHVCFHCEEQRYRKDCNLSDVKFTVSWNLLGSGPDPVEL